MQNLNMPFNMPVQKFLDVCVCACAVFKNACAEFESVFAGFENACAEFVDVCVRACVCVRVCVCRI